MPQIPLVVRNSLRHEVDGGWAWVVVAASFMIQTILFGIIQSYGTMFVALLDEFKSGEYETAWIGSMGYGLTFFIGPIYATLSEHYGCRKMVYCGTLICMVACFSSSFAPNLSTLYFTFGILWAIGAGMTFFPCLLVLNFYFSKRISLANGITMAGSATGTLIFNATLNRILELYDWRVGFRLFGGICALMFVCGSAYLPPPQDFYAIQEWEQYQKVKLTTKLARIFDIRPWKEKAFVVWLIGVSFVLFGYFVPYVHLVRFGVTLNVPLSKGTLLVGYMSISQIFAKLICGHLADMRKVKRLQILIVAVLAFAICNFAVTAATDFTGLLTYALFYGFFDGLFVVVLPILIRDLVGRELMANAIGNFYGLVSVPLTLGPPISGQLYDVFGSYKVPFSVSGGSMLIAGVMMYFVYRLKPELLKDLPSEPEDTFTSDLIARPSIHSHTVDALSGMFLTERFSAIDSVDRPSQLTINPLHNFASVLIRSRAGSTISGRTGQRFPSFSLDMRSDGASEIFLQRLRGCADGASVGLSDVTGKDLSSNTSTDHDVLSATKDLSLESGSHRNVALASSLNKMSAATLTAKSNTDLTPTEAGNLVGNNHSMDKCMVRIVEPGEDSSPEKIQHEQTADITTCEIKEAEDSAKQDNLANLEESTIDTALECNQILIQISTSEELNSASSIPDMAMEGITKRSTSTAEAPQTDDLCPDISADRTSSPILQPFESARTPPLISIDIDESIIEEADITLVPDNIDTETTTETIVPDDVERSTDEIYGDEELIKLPPPPTWNREAPLVDLTEAAFEISANPVVNEDSLQAEHDGCSFEGASRSSSTNVQSSTDFLSLNERLMIMAEQQKQEGELKLRFPTDEMTLFATYRSNIATPAEQQGTPVCETIPQTPAPSASESPPRTPSQVHFQHNGTPLQIIPCHVNDQNVMDIHHQSSDDILGRLETCSTPSNHLISSQFEQRLPDENRVETMEPNLPEVQRHPKIEPYPFSENAQRETHVDVYAIEPQINTQVLSLDSQGINPFHQDTTNSLQQTSPERNTLLLTETNTTPITGTNEFEDQSLAHPFTTQTYEHDNDEQSPQTYPQVKCTPSDSANINDLLINIASTSINNPGESSTNPFLQEINDSNNAVQSHTSADQVATLVPTDNNNNTPYTPPSSTEKQDDNPCIMHHFQYQRAMDDDLLPHATSDVQALTSASSENESKDEYLQIVFAPTTVDKNPDEDFATQAFKQERFVDDDIIQPPHAYAELQLASESTTTSNDLIDITSAFQDRKPEEEWTSNQFSPEIGITFGSTGFKDINSPLTDSIGNHPVEKSTLSEFLQERPTRDEITEESPQAHHVPVSCKSDPNIMNDIIKTVFENIVPSGECTEHPVLQASIDRNSATPKEHLTTSADFNPEVECNTNPFLQEKIDGNSIIQLSQTSPKTLVSTSAESKPEESVARNPFLQETMESYNNEQARQTISPDATSQVQTTYTSATNNDFIQISKTSVPGSQFDRCTNLVISHLDEKDKMQQICSEVVHCKTECLPSDDIKNINVLSTTSPGNGPNDKCTNPFPDQRSNIKDDSEAKCVTDESALKEKTDIQQRGETPTTETIRNPFINQDTNAECLNYGVWVKGSLDTDSVATKAREDTSNSSNPFVPESAGRQDSQEQVFLIPSHQETNENNQESSAINVPLDGQTYRRKSFVIDDNSDCGQSNSNSLVNVFELELDEHDKENTDGKN